MVRVLLNPFILDCQSNPNPLKIYDCQSKSKSTFQNGMTIQSKSNHNPKKNSVFVKCSDYFLKMLSPHGPFLHPKQHTNFFYWIVIGFGLDCQSILKSGFRFGFSITNLKIIWIGLSNTLEVGHVLQ